MLEILRRYSRPLRLEGWGSSLASPFVARVDDLRGPAWLEAMIHIDFTSDDIDALHHERLHHPHPRVQFKMEVVYLKSQGLAHEDICRLAWISENTPALTSRHTRRASPAN